MSATLKQQFLGNLPAPPGEDRIRSVVRAYLASFASRDVEARAALFAANVRVEDPVGTAPIVGLDALRSFWAMSSGAFDVSATPKRIIVCGNEACVEFEAKLNAGGDQATISCIETFKLSDAGLIVEMRAFFDRTCIS